MGNMKKNNIAELMKEILKFRDKRDWAQFHYLMKDLVLKSFQKKKEF